MKRTVEHEGLVAPGGDKDAAPKCSACADSGEQQRLACNDFVMSEWKPATSASTFELRVDWLRPFRVERRPCPECAMGLIEPAQAVGEGVGDGGSEPPVVGVSSTRATREACAATGRAGTAPHPALPGSRWCSRHGGVRAAKGFSPGVIEAAAGSRERVESTQKAFEDLKHFPSVLMAAARAVRSGSRRQDLVAAIDLVAERTRDRTLGRCHTTTVEEAEARPHWAQTEPGEADRYRSIVRHLSEMLGIDEGGGRLDFAEGVTKYAAARAQARERLLRRSLAPGVAEARSWKKGFEAGRAAGVSGKPVFSGGRMVGVVFDPEDREAEESVSWFADQGRAMRDEMLAMRDEMLRPFEGEATEVAGEDPEQSSDGDFHRTPEARFLARLDRIVELLEGQARETLRAREAPQGR